MGLTVVAIAGPGCEDKRRHQTSAGVDYVDVVCPVASDATPAEVARAFLAAVREAQHARLHGLGRSEDEEAYDRAMGKIGTLAAAAWIHEKMLKTRSPTLPAGLTEQAAVTLVSESWVSIAAYYVDGFLFETLSLPSKGPAPQASVRAYIEAERPEDRERLEEVEALPDVAGAVDGDGKPLVRGSKAYVKLTRSKALAQKPAFNVPIRARFTIDLRQVDGAWRVAGLTIGPAPSQQPTTAPVPQPASAPATTSDNADPRE